MHGTAIKKEKSIRFIYKTLHIRFWRFEFQIYFKTHLWTKKYTYYNTGKINGYKGFVLIFWPFAFSYQIRNKINEKRK